MVLSRNGEIWCRDERRDSVLLHQQHPLNGLEYVEYHRDPTAPVGKQFWIGAHFLKAPLPSSQFQPEAHISGGVRIVGVQVLQSEADANDPSLWRFYLDREGDFSTYVLTLDEPSLDRERSQARFSFKAGCPSEFDCHQVDPCQPPPRDEPDLDYLAKDYQSFRRLLLDLIAVRNPNWQERLPADFSIALVEMLAYVGDYLSYLQDAGPSTESFFDTCRQRVSMQRHARLIDYAMHQGRNAATFVQFDLKPKPAADNRGRVVPAGTKLCTRIARPLIGEGSPPDALLPATADFDADPALEGATVFETTALITASSDNNLLFLHTFGDVDCCLGQGARQAYLYGINGNTIIRPKLSRGDYLLLEEVRNPRTGSSSDVDPYRRAIVRLEAIDEKYEDKAFSDMLSPTGELIPRKNPTPQTSTPKPMPLLHVTWRAEDALKQPFCLTSETSQGFVDHVTIVRGNVAPADHGCTVRRDSLPIQRGTGRWPLATLQLPDGDLTWQAGHSDQPLFADGRPVLGRFDLDAPAREAVPAVHLRIALHGGSGRYWSAVPHLGDSDAYDRHFVAETDDSGFTTLRFGDNDYGRDPTNAYGRDPPESEAVTATAFYRIGSGRKGNISAGALVHAVKPDLSFWTAPNQSSGPQSLNPANPGAQLAFAEIIQVRQPLPAIGGTDPETVEEVRSLAPEEMRALQFRAVTAADWQDMALRYSGVAAAKARFRWIGSWYCVFVAIHPTDPSHLRRHVNGAVALDEEFAEEIKAHLVRFKLAGRDLTIRAAQYVPLEIDILICVAPGYFRGHVLQAVAEVLSNRRLPTGGQGFFYLPSFEFGEDIHLSGLYAAMEAVDGVQAAEVTLFKRYWEQAGDELERGRIALGEFEIARLDNDPNAPENGVLRLTGMGGS